jgi:hypothetical protein
LVVWWWVVGRWVVRRWVVGNVGGRNEELTSLLSSYTMEPTNTLHDEHLFNFEVVRPAVPSRRVLNERGVALIRIRASLRAHTAIARPVYDVGR